MADILKPDLCIIGAGALGTGLAIKARQRGLDVVLVDRGTDEAGDPRQGSLLRAAFAASAERAHFIRTAGALGLDNAEPKPNFRAISEHASAVAESAGPRDSTERLTALGIAVHVGNTAFVDRQTLKVGDSVVKARRFVLATGARPAVPELPGLESVPYFTPDTILDNMRKLSHLVVIGGDATALELAQAYRRLGSAVTVVPHGALLAGFDVEIVAILLRALADEGVEIIEEAAAVSIQPRNQGTGVTIRRADGSEQALDASHILLALNRVPDLDPALLEKAKLRRDKLRPDQLLLGANGQTSNSKISAIGGAAGEYRPQAAARQADAVLDQVTGSRAGADPARIPRLVTTSPALAQIGEVETLKALRPGFLVLRAAFVENDAARATGTAYGTAKLIVGRNGAIRGGTVIGPAAAEIVAMLAIAMDRRMSAADLAHLSLPDPSPTSMLADLGAQYVAQQPPTPWARRRAALRKLLP